MSQRHVHTALIRAVVLLQATPLLGCYAQKAPPAGPLSERPDLRYSVRNAAPATHRFWSAKHWFATNVTNEGHAYTMFAEPLAVQTTPAGLLVGSSTQVIAHPDFFVHPIQPDFTVGTARLSASHVDVTTETDRMVEFDFGTLRTRVARGMPFVYAQSTGPDITVRFTAPPVVFRRTGNALGVQLGQNLYALFCPSSGTWTAEENVFTCHPPPGRHYLSIGVLPAESTFSLFAQYAFTFPADTGVTWAYDPAESRVTTTFTVSADQKEGVAPAGGFLQALYPHQYTHLRGPGASSTLTYASARGPMRLLAAPGFTTVSTYRGMLPFLPLPSGTPAQQALLQHDAGRTPLFDGGDTYSRGKSLNRVAQLLPIASALHDNARLAALAAALSRQLDEWQLVQNRPAFTYDPRWHTLVGHPAAYGSDTQLNDHHFHYGYWIQAAAMLSLFHPEWLQNPAHTAFLRQLARDIANTEPTDTRYPLLRHFDAYAGHSWASGQAPFGDGQNQESSSEAVNAWAGLALFAAQTHDTRLRDTAVWMYTLETEAAETYWFDDGPVRTFPPTFHKTQIANLFDGKADTATWFGNAPEFEHGIEFLPFTGASLYLGRDRAYTRRNLAEVTSQTGGALRTSSTFWPDLMEMYEAFHDPQKALEQWRGTPFTFDGETRTHELAWLTSLQAYGAVDATVTADTPFYAVFSRAGQPTHIAFNPDSTPIHVRFSDGYRADVPAHSMSNQGKVLPFSEPH